MDQIGFYMGGANIARNRRHAGPLRRARSLSRGKSRRQIRYRDFLRRRLSDDLANLFGHGNVVGRFRQEVHDAAEGVDDKGH